MTLEAELILYKVAVLMLVAAIGWMDWRHRKVNSFAVAALLAASIMQYTIGKAGGSLIVTEVDILMNLVVAMLLAAPGYAFGVINANGAKVLVALSPLCQAPLFIALITGGAVMFAIIVLFLEYSRPQDQSAGGADTQVSVLADLQQRGVPTASVLACGTLLAMLA